MVEMRWRILAALCAVTLGTACGDDDTGDDTDSDASDTVDQDGDQEVTPDAVEDPSTDPGTDPISDPGTDPGGDPDVAPDTDAETDSDAETDTPDGSDPPDTGDCSGVINPCDTAGASCDGQTLVQCDEDTNGCLVETRTDCASADGTCDDTQEPALCVTDGDPCEDIDECAAGTYCDESGAVIVCAADAFGCFVETPTTCEAGQSCQADGESAACQDDGPVVCFTPDHMLGCASGTVTFDTADGSSNLDGYEACGTDEDYVGKELLLGFAHDVAVDLRVVATRLGGSADFDLFAIATGDDCEETCLDDSTGLGSTETVTFVYEPGTTLYFAYDIYDAPAATTEASFAVTCTPRVCGDGIRASNEACDDGNTEPGDGCSATCAVEATYICTGTPSVCRQELCGDGQIVGGETCDDGNTEPGDGCSATCRTETNFTCTGTPSVCRALRVCGDGLIDSPETCDDSNTEAGDGCSDTCRTETGFICSGTPSVCRASNVCGDGFKDASEACDDGNTADADGCSSTCTIETGYLCTGGSPTTPSTCRLPLGCGDGFVDAPEQCDDGNDESGDGCSDTCRVEAGFGCIGEPSDCVPGTALPALGSSVTAEGTLREQTYLRANNVCSTTNLNVPYEALRYTNTSTNEAKIVTATALWAGFDGYLILHRLSFVPRLPTFLCATGNDDFSGLSDSRVTGFRVAPNETIVVVLARFSAGEPADYTLTIATTSAVTCGDGVLGTGETCDDGGNEGGDGCSSICAVEEGYTCSGTPSVCVLSCGNGTLQTGETCDDGNAAAGDGCSDTCQIEDGYVCEGLPSNCFVPACGDGSVVIALGEQCDDGTGGETAGCDVDCLREPGYACIGAPSACDLGDLFPAVGETSVINGSFTEESPTAIRGLASCGRNTTANQETPYATYAFTNDRPYPLIVGFLAEWSGFDGYLMVYDGTYLPAENNAFCIGGNDDFQGDEDFSAGELLIEPGATVVVVLSQFNNSESLGDFTLTVFNFEEIVCGNGTLEGDEVCDDANEVDGDGCSATCEIEEGFVCDDELPSFCREFGICGDGFIEGGELCDDGNDAGGDGCDADCVVEDDYFCSGEPSSCVLPVCGDGVIEGLERCDDGGTDPDDGCSDVCTVEEGFACTGEPSVCEPSTIPPIPLPGAPALLITGALESTDETFARPLATCSGVSGVGSAVYFDQYVVRNASASPVLVTVEAQWEGFDGFLLLFQADFAPATPLDTCLIGNDDGATISDSRIANYRVDAGESFIIVPTSFENGETGDYTISVTTTTVP